VGGPYEFRDGSPALRMILRGVNRLNPRHITSSICGMNMAFRRDAYEGVGGFSPRINLQADTYLGERLKKIGRIYFFRDNIVFSSARRYRSASQIVSELVIRLSNVIALRMFHTTLFSRQIDYR